MRWLGVALAGCIGLSACGGSSAAAISAGASPPPPSALAPSSPAPSLPQPSSPAPSSVAPSSVAPSSPAPSSPAPSSVAPSLTAPSSPAPSSPQPSLPPAGSPAPSLPPAGSPAPGGGGTALQPAVTITLADDNKTVQVKVGQVVDVDLQAGQGMQDWQVQNPNPGILQPIVNPAAAAVRGATLRAFKAIAAGSTAIQATDRPQCNPGQACPQFIRAFKATVVVAPG